MNRWKGVNPRIEKIKLLRDIDRGKIKANDFQSKKLEVRIGYGPDDKYFINGQAVPEHVFRAEEKKQELTNTGLEIEVGYGPEIDQDFDDEE